MAWARVGHVRPAATLRVHPGVIGPREGFFLKKKRRFESLVELGPLRVCENVHLQDPFVEKGGGAVPAT